MTCSRFSSHCPIFLSFDSFSVSKRAISSLFSSTAFFIRSYLESSVTDAVRIARRLGSYPILSISSCLSAIFLSRSDVNISISSSHFFRLSSSTGRLLTSSTAFDRNLQLALSISGHPEFFMNSSCCLISAILFCR